MNDDKEWNVEKLLGLSGSFWNTCTLHAGVKLGLFTFIGNDEITAKEVARRSCCSVRGIEVILNALSAMGLLVKKEDKYINTTASRSFLVKGVPGYIGYMVMHHYHLVKTWAQLDHAVESGKPVRKKKTRNGEERESFLMGMFNIASGVAPRLSKKIELKGRRHLLDLGGGTGTYAIHFCLANPGLKGTVYDLQTTRPFAEKTIAQFGLSDRIGFIGGNYLEDEIEGTFDVAWLSHIFHGEGPDACRMIIEKAVSAIEPGGVLLIHDFILNNALDGPLFPALFSLIMLGNTASGRSYSEDQIKKMLNAAGLQNIHRLSLKGPNDSGIISGMV